MNKKPPEALENKKISRCLKQCHIVVERLIQYYLSKVPNLQDSYTIIRKIHLQNKNPILIF